MSNQVKNTTVSREYSPEALPESGGEARSWRRLNSSALSALRYSAPEQTLWLSFRSGALYRYRGVPASVAGRLLSAESHGRAFVQQVRGRYPAERLL